MSEHAALLHARLDDGREVACWVSRPAPHNDRGAAVVLCSAFGRRMHQHSTLAAYLSENGVGVLRFDAVNHVGLSDGTPEAYTLSDGLSSLAAAAAAAKTIFPGATLGLVATSLNARLALKTFASDPQLAFLIGIAGVVDVRATLGLALGEDYHTVRPEDLPERITFEGLPFGARRFHEDYHRCSVQSLDSTLEALSAIARPVVWFVGERDPWIASSDVARCAAIAPGWFTPVTLRDCGHDLTRNPAMARRVLVDVVARCLAFAGVDAPVVEPGHARLMELALEERRWQRASVAPRVLAPA